MLRGMSGEMRSLAGDGRQRYYILHDIAWHCINIGRLTALPPSLLGRNLLRAYFPMIGSQTP